MTNEHSLVGGRLYEKINKALDELIVIADRNMIRFSFAYPEAGKSMKYSYSISMSESGSAKDIQSEVGSWAGIYYNLYSLTDDIRYYHYADTIFKSVRSYIEKTNMNSIDIGRIALLTMMYKYKYKNSRTARKTMHQASASLLTNYITEFECISVWNDYADHNIFNVRVEDLQNIMLLRWLDSQKRSRELESIIDKSIDKILKYNIRSFDNVYGRYYFDSITGAPIEGYYCLRNNEYPNVTRFPMSVSNVLFGLALHYAASSEDRYLELFLNLAKPFFADYDEKGCYYCIDGRVEYDTKSTLIAICAVMEMKSALDQAIADIDLYYEKALAMLEYIVDNKRISPDCFQDGFVSGCTRYFYDIHPNVANITGDYFYIEALLRCIGKYKEMWY